MASLGNWVVAPSFGRGTVYDFLIFRTWIYGSFSTIFFLRYAGFICGLFTFKYAKDHIPNMAGPYAKVNRA